MWMYLMIGIPVIGCLGLLLSQMRFNHRPTDSALKQRAIFSPQQRLLYQRLKTLLPEQNILAQVSFDALVTTKYARTRYKYRNMVADFVILNQEHHILAVLALIEASGLKKCNKAYYEDDLLKMAGYKVLRYRHVPTLFELQHDFKNANIVFDQVTQSNHRDKNYQLSHVPM